jgi:hypothetical protein
VPYSFNDIFCGELRSLRLRRLATGRPPLPRSKRGDRPDAELGLTGVALSGGGVRSASFCLGVLQALHAEVGLGQFDYLSTVSGGGYIGASTSIGMSVMEGRFPFGRTGAEPGETPETQHLRDNSRYLVKDGLPSVISALAVYLRGIVMNAMIIAPLLFLVAAVLVLATLGRAWARTWLASEGQAGLPGRLAGVAAWLGEASLPLTVLAAILLAATWAAYAILVSVHRIGDLRKRQHLARWAGVLLGGVALAVLVLDLHPALLERMSLPVAPDQENGGAGGAGAQLGVLNAVKTLGLTLAPLAALLVPYLKPVVAKAASGAAGTWGDALKRVGSRLVLLAVAALIPLLLWAWTLQLALWGLHASACAGSDKLLVADLLGMRVDCNPALGPPGWLAAGFAWAGPVPAFCLAALPLLAAWPFLNVNANSLHQLYRDRLGSAFLVAAVADGPSGAVRVKNCDDFPLSRLSARHAPYHLFNCALNVPGSREANKRGRNADFFIFSRCFIGSPLTGYVRTRTAERILDRLNVGTAMAISGAAAAPNMGMASMRPLSPTIALLNVRLGRWLRHPRRLEEDALAGRGDPRPGPRYFLREAFSKSGFGLQKNGIEGMEAGPASAMVPNAFRPPEEVSEFVFLTDGGHIENLGIYELLRRRCRLIVAVDAEADPAGRCLSLEQVERFARIDLGTRILIDMRPILQASAAVKESLRAGRLPERKAGPHVALGIIDYPPREDSDGPRQQGVLIYVKASLSGDENDYVVGYALRHAEFPQETTADQLFSEEQLEAYRALGEHAARRFLTGTDPCAAEADRREDLLQQVRTLLPGAQPV